MMQASQIGNIPFDITAISSLYPHIKSVANKATELEKNNVIIRIKKGLYVFSPQASGALLSTELIANHLYGPSYLSMHTALRYYGLIPESVASTISMTTKHSKQYDTPIGYFQYIYCPTNYFSIGVKSIQHKNIAYLMASPEKALCDLLIYTPNLNLRFKHEVLTYLKENLRLDMEQFYKMDVSIFSECAKICKKKSLINNIIKILSR